MMHKIIIYGKLKRINKDGNWNYRTVTHYQLTDEEICEQEEKKYIEDNDIPEDDKWEYFAQIDETIH